MKQDKVKRLNRSRRARRVRVGTKGTGDQPRLSVFRSNRHVRAQLIDDARGITLASSSDDKMPKDKSKKKLALAERSSLVGEDIAAKAKVMGIRRVCFDRGGYRYHGSVAVLAAAARKGGLKF